MEFVCRGDITKVRTQIHENFKLFFSTNYRALFKVLKTQGFQWCGLPAVAAVAAVLAKLTDSAFHATCENEFLKLLKLQIIL